MSSSIKVIFRTFKKGGDVIALFPYELGNYNPATCSSYQHVGQHGAADPQHVIKLTRPSTSGEIKKLAAELQRIGYTIKILKKNPAGSYEARRKRLILIYGP